VTTAIPHRVHFVGVGGSGLSALARVTMGLGSRVTGSDRVRGDEISSLQALGLTFQVGHEPDLVKDAEMVVITSAIREEVPEVAWARARGVTVCKRHQYLPLLAQGKRMVAIAGTHGKTTTTALLAHVLAETDRDPTAVVGGMLESWGSNARVGESDLFVVEADEYDRMFLSLNPWLGVLTIVEADHPDCYPDRAAMEAAFSQFARQCRSLVVNGDDPGIARALAAAGVGSSSRYGRGVECNWRLLAAAGDHDATTVSFRAPNGCSHRARVRMWGAHSAANCLAAVAAAFEVGVPPAEASEALSSFEGVRRRFSVRGPFSGVFVVDDYAHHPTEVRAVVDSARQRFAGRRILVVLQPHTFSRLEQHFEDFVEALRLGDEAFVLPVYASREAGDSVAAAALLARAAGAVALPPVAEAAGPLLQHVRPGDVVLNLGAGDAQSLSSDLIAALADGDVAPAS